MTPNSLPDYYFMPMVQPRVDRLPQRVRTKLEDMRKVAVALGALPEGDKAASELQAELPRLALETKLIYLKSAIDLAKDELGGWKKVFESSPLLNCLNRIRNVVVHKGQLQVRKELCTLGTNVPGREPQTETQPLTWAYLFLRAEDSDLQNPGDKYPLPSIISRWFREQCSFFPFAWLLGWGQIELCWLFDPQSQQVCRVVRLFESSGIGRPLVEPARRANETVQSPRGREDCPRQGRDSSPDRRDG